MKKVFKIFLLLLIAACCNTSISAQTTAEVDALLDFYRDMNGSLWNNPALNPGNRWIRANPVTNWYGVRIQGDRVIGLDLDGKVDANYLNFEVGDRIGVSGTIPATFSNLTSLRFLSLSNNSNLTPAPSPLSKPNPALLTISTLTNLEYLFVSHCGLEGTIPPSMNTKLQWLYLNDNQLNGAIPDLSGLTQLQHLYLSFNQLGLLLEPPTTAIAPYTSGIPSELARLSTLRELKLDYNKLIGPIPDVWTCSGLGILLLNDNKLINGIPTALGNLINLKYFILSNNRLGYNAQSIVDGSIPIGILPTLGIPNIPTNLFANLPNLIYLGFANNDLVGKIPEVITPMPNLIEMILHTNKLGNDGSGIPASFGTKLPNLQKLFVHNNRLKGDIPSFANLIDRRDIIVSNNRFVFGDMVGDSWLSSPNKIYAPQDTVLPINFASGVLTASLTNLTTAANSTYTWFKDNVQIVGTPTTPNPVVGSNLYTPTQSGVYCYKVTHNPITQPAYSVTNLILSSDCLNVTVAPPCCEKALIVATKGSCCSQLTIDCPIKSVKVTLTGGKLTTLTSNCGSVPTGFAGLSSYTLTPTISCLSTSINACFESTGLGSVTINYLITFADGTTCVKEEKKLCCCTPKVRVLIEGCATRPHIFYVDDINCKFTNGKWDFGDGTTSGIANTTHVYNAVGIYNATFYYTNDCGSFKFPVTIDVKECPLTCCEQAVVSPAKGMCCSQIKIDCPIKSVKVTLLGGTFTNLTTSCGTPTAGYIGLSTYTILSNSQCTSTIIDNCFSGSNANGVTEVTYFITFADGTTCEKQDKIECIATSCCERAVITPIQEKCCSQIKIDCAIKSVKVTLTGGTFTSLSGQNVSPVTGSVGGLSLYTFTPSGSLPSASINACFRATGAGPVIITYFITFADGTTCTKEEKKSCLTVTPSVTIATRDSVICAGTSVTFTATPTNGGTTPIYQWRIGNTIVSTGATFTTTSLTNGNIISCIMTSNAPNASPTMVSSNSITMTVNAVPTINAVPNQTVCAGSTTTAINFTGTGATSYTWTNDKTATGLAASGTGNIAAFIAINTTTTPISSTITVTPVGVCKGTPKTFTLTVNPSPTVVISPSNGLALTCIVRNTVLTASGGGTYLWSTNPITIHNNTTAPVINVTTAGTYTVTVTGANGCKTSRNVIVSQNITSPTVSISGGNLTCAITSTTLTAIGGGTYSWSPNAGNATTAAIPVTTAGTYTVTVTDIKTGCKTVASKVVTNCCCTPKITVTRSGCKGIAVRFVADTTNCKFTNGRWDFGDGTSSNVANTTHIYYTVGDFKAVFYYTNDCGTQSALSFPVTIKECPCELKPCISYKTTDFSVSFSGAGSVSNYPITGYHWDFGDGSWANGANPVYTYTKEGVYKVCLSVYADNGEGLCACVGKICVEVVVKKGASTGSSTCRSIPVAPPTAPPASSSNSNTNATSLKMSVFPNPVSNNLTVVFDKQVSDTEGVSSQLELYNLQGQLLKQQPLETGLDETKVSMQQLPAGVYMMSLRQNGQIISTVKVTKN
jgi:PKD repeat protein/Leucine-rich repeat (LRR) protein